MVNSTTSLMWKEVLEVGILVIFWWAFLQSVCAGHYQRLPCRLASDCPRHHQPPPTASDFTTFQLPTIIISHCSQSQWRSSPSPPQLGHHDFTSDNGAGDGRTIIRYFPHQHNENVKILISSLYCTLIYICLLISISVPAETRGESITIDFAESYLSKHFRYPNLTSRSLSFSTINSIIYYFVLYLKLEKRRGENLLSCKVNITNVITILSGLVVIYLNAI